MVSLCLNLQLNGISFSVTYFYPSYWRSGGIHMLIRVIFTILFTILFIILKGLLREILAGLDSLFLLIWALVHTAFDIF
jgi:hypothetical protein